MLIRPISDLHIEQWDKKEVNKNLNKFIPYLDTDKETVLCIAGDIGQLHKDWTFIDPLNYLSNRFKAIVATLSNHSFYDNYSFPNIPKNKINKGNVHILYNDYIFMDDVAFIGGTLWTNFDNNPLYEEIARRGMNDYRAISVKIDNTTRRLLPEDTVLEFYKAKNYIFKAISVLKESGFKTVVVTHHSPTPESVHERFTGDDLNYAFFTDLRDEIEHNGPTIFHYGHQHSYYKGRLGNTRLILNPLGYIKYGEVSGYDNKLVMEV